MVGGRGVKGAGSRLSGFHCGTSGFGVGAWGVGLSAWGVLERRVITHHGVSTEYNALGNEVQVTAGIRLPSRP